MKSTRITVLLTLFLTSISTQVAGISYAQEVDKEKEIIDLLDTVHRHRVYFPELGYSSLRFGDDQVWVSQHVNTYAIKSGDLHLDGFRVKIPEDIGEKEFVWAMIPPTNLHSWFFVPLDGSHRDKKRENPKSLVGYRHSATSFGGSIVTTQYFGHDHLKPGTEYMMWMAFDNNKPSVIHYTYSIDDIGSSVNKENKAIPTAAVHKSLGIDKQELLGLRFEVQDDKKVVVSSVFHGSSAKDAGLSSGDQILSVNGNIVNGKTTQEILGFLSQEKHGATVAYRKANGAAVKNAFLQRRLLSVVEAYDHNNLVKLKNGKLNNAWGNGGSLPPIVGGQWENVEHQERLKAIANFNAASRKKNLPVVLDGGSRVRRLELDFYENTFLYQYEILSDEKEPIGIYNLLSDNEQHTILKGSKSDFSNALSSDKIDLSTPDKSAAYLRFFCGLIQDEKGPFQIVSNVNELTWEKDTLNTEKGKKDKEEASRSIIPIRYIGRIGGSSLFSVNMVHGDSLFLAYFRISSGGNVTMTSDHLLLDGLTTQQYRYSEGILRPDK